MYCSRNTIYFCLFIVIALVILETWTLTRLQPQKIRVLRMQLYVFLAVALCFCSKYVWKRFRVLVNKGRTLETVLKFTILVLLVMAQASSICIIFFTQTDPSWLSFIATFSLGSILLTTFCIMVSDVCSFIYQRMFCKRRIGPLNRVEIKIRSILSLISALIIIIIGTMCVNNLTVERVVVPVKGLHPTLNGTTIVQISDLHLGPFNGKSTLTSIVEKINKLKSDIVVITGDLVDSSVEALHGAVKPLKNLKAKYGVYYITGNHEYYTGDVDNWLDEIPKLNITTLVNRRVCVLSSNKSTCEKGLYIAGLEDLVTRNMRYGAHSMDIHSALSGRSKNIPTVVLAHQPWAAFEAIAWRDVRLVLSGHTHAGQILPMMLPTYLYNPFFVGLYQPHPDVYVYVNPGTLYYFIPFRHYRPEITYFTLVNN